MTAIPTIKTHVRDFDSGMWVRVEKGKRSVPRRIQLERANAILAAQRDDDRHVEPVPF